MAKLKRRTFLGGVLAAFGVRLLPKVRPRVKPEQWTQLIYGVPLVFTRRAPSYSVDYETYAVENERC